MKKQRLARYFLLAIIYGSSAFAVQANKIAVNPASYSVNENAGQAGVIVRLTRDPNDMQIVTVDFATSNGTAIVGSDYLGANGTLTFAANESVKLVQLSIINDFIAESSENFFLTLLAATNAMMTTKTATVTIVDDDGSANGINFVSFSSADYGTGRSDPRLLSRFAINPFERRLDDRR